MHTGKHNVNSGDCNIEILAGYNASPETKMKYFNFISSSENMEKPTDLHKYRLSNYIPIAISQEPLIKVKEDVDRLQLLPLIKNNNNDNEEENPTPLLAARINTQSYHREKLSSHTMSMDWNNYHRLKVIHDFMDDLEYRYPSLCSVGVIGCSIEGRDLKIIKISNSDANNCGVWIDAGVHAREWIGPAVNTYIANYIANNFSTLPQYVTNKDWYFLPVANPDGYEYSHTVDRMWRKNKACINGKCCGVDLNRNFSYGWGGKGSSPVPTHNFFRGREPFSEPEACAMRDVLSNDALCFKVYITLHSYGQVIIFPFASTDKLCPGYIRLLEGATVMSKAIYNTSGTTYKVGISKDVMYHASGTSNDWSHGAVGIPYCYLLELRSRKHRFKLPREEIEETGNEILNCIFALMEFVDSYPKDKLLAEKAVNIWKEEPTNMDILVEGNRLSSVGGMFHEREIPYTVAIADVNAIIELQQTSLVKNFSKSSCIMDWTSYHRLETINKFLMDLERKFPDRCSVHEIGTSVEGKQITMLRISNGKTSNEGVWIDGAIHPREWISTAVVTYIADCLARTFDSQPEYVINKDWYFLPVLNPDGYEYTHTLDRMWRKNRAQYGPCVGVDLNRNFSCGWGENGEEGSSSDPGNVFYKGPEPFSEPETKAVRRAIMEADTNFKVFLSLHSYGEVIIFPWGYTESPCPDYVELLEGGTAMSKAIHDTNGRIYKVGSTKDLMYYAAGTSIDWAYGVANIPYSYMVELRDKKNRFLLPSEEILETSVEVFNGILGLMKFVDKRNKGTQAGAKSNPVYCLATNMNM